MSQNVFVWAKNPKKSTEVVLYYKHSFSHSKKSLRKRFITLYFLERHSHYKVQLKRTTCKESVGTIMFLLSQTTVST